MGSHIEVLKMMRSMSLKISLVHPQILRQSPVS